MRRGEGRSETDNHEPGRDGLSPAKLVLVLVLIVGNGSTEHGRTPSGAGSLMIYTMSIHQGLIDESQNETGEARAAENLLN